MTKAVIVEDEMLVRMGLKSCLEADRELTVIGTFALAEEAEAFIRAEQVDVMITDVRLPGMNGLELIRRAKMINPELTVIVLSCYEDFNYARTALELGAARYLLKHELNEAELPSLIRGLLGDSSKKRVSRKAEPERLEDIVAKSNKGGVRLMAFCFRGCEESTNASVQELNLDMLAQLIGSALVDRELGRCIVWKEQMIVGILPERKELIGKLLICYREISDNMGLFIDKNCYAGVSDVFSDVSLISKYLTEAAERSKQSFYCEYSTVFFSDIMENSVCPSLVFTRTDAFTENWLEKIYAAIDSFFISCRHGRPPAEQIKEAVVRFLHAMLAHGEQYFNLKTELAYPADALPGYQMVSHFDSMEALRVWLKETLRQTVQYINSQESLSANIRTYIEANYSRYELRQSDVAEYFHMSSPYFSQYFKEHFGVNYVQYLNSMRIDQAKILLRTTNYSTETIAEKVGIDNVNYFFRLFKKIEGCTVKIYRRENREQNLKK